MKLCVSVIIQEVGERVLLQSQEIRVVFCGVPVELQNQANNLSCGCQRNAIHSSRFTRRPRQSLYAYDHGVGVHDMVSHHEPAPRRDVLFMRCSFDLPFFEQSRKSRAKPFDSNRVCFVSAPDGSIVDKIDCFCGD